MKKQIILFIALLILIVLTTSIVSAANFSDISTHKYKNAIEYIADLDIVEGYEDGSYRPDENINRAELLKIILEANNIETDQSADNCFDDVSGQWYSKYVCTAKNLELIEGYEDNTFKPANNINFAEALKIIQLTYGETPEPSNPWYQTYLDEAESKNMIPYDVYSFDQLITRGQMADIITRYLTHIDGTQDEYIESLDLLTYPIVLESNYTDNGNGTVTDNVTGLMWQKDPGSKMSYDDAVMGADSFDLAGYYDWRLPTIKELYSLIDFEGVDPSGPDMNSTEGLIPFIDDDYFDFEYGNPADGDRIIDSQWTTSTKYVSTVMGGQECFFGVNFADGRIKCYPTQAGKGYFTIYVRGNLEYGLNDFIENGDGTVTDEATGLMWQKFDSGASMVWDHASNQCEVANTGGYFDWRLPDVKELQSIVDYSRSPETTDSAAINAKFVASEITDEDGYQNFPWYWSNTTHKNLQGDGNAAYVAFGEALGWMQIPPGSEYQLLDVHGAGAQRSDPKQGDPGDYPNGHGPQGDVIRIFNYVKCVR